MNHKYPLLVLAALASGVQAQRVTQHTVRTFAENLQVAKPAAITEGEAKAGGDVVFSENFLNGLAGNNTFGPWTVTGPDGAIWKRDTDGPNGGFSGTFQVIGSTTAGNGFMMFDSDYSNSDTLVDPVVPLPDTEFLARDGYLESPALDLSATPDVLLTFQQRGRWCCGTDPVHFVDVSVDGGASWPARIPALIYYQFANQDPGTYTQVVNLHDAIGGNAGNVKFRFAHEGTSGSGAGVSHYYWQIDDVKLVESHGNDLDMLQPGYNAYNARTDLTDKAEFDIIPASQLHEFQMGSPVTNYGANEATNVSLQMVVTQDANEVFNQAATVPSIAPNALDSGFYLPFTPAGIGEYALSLNLTSDSVDSELSGNTDTREWEVSDYVYAQDEGSRDNAYRRLNPNDNTQILEYLACNFFWLENNATLYAIQVAVAGGTGLSQVGGELDGVMLMSVEGGFEELGVSNLFEITANSQLTANGQAKFQSLMFEPPLDLTGGQEVCACMHAAGAEGGSIERVAVATSGRVLPGLSVFMNASDGTAQQGIQDSPMVRMNFNPSVGIEEADRQNDIGMGQNFPNPAHGVTYIPYDLKEAASLTFEVHDMSGKLVATQAVGKRGAGAHRLQFDTMALNEGVYFYSLTANGTRLTKRMTVIR